MIDFRLKIIKQHLYTAARLLSTPKHDRFNMCYLQVFRMSSYVGGFGILVIIFEILYVCFTLYFVVRLVNLLRKERLKYFKVSGMHIYV